MSFTVAIRADASVTIGTGHIMRCLTLARALAARGHRCYFVCRDLPGHLCRKIVAEGFAVILLPAPSAPFSPLRDVSVHAAWAEVPWEQDAAETGAAVTGADWMIVDHYSFDAQWQTVARPVGARLMVIDDLADRPHDCDLLMDQNLGRHATSYETLLPHGTEQLIGPHYALLRPEFSQARDATLKSRANRGYRLSNVLVTMGGIDLPNASGSALKVLSNRPEVRVTVVLGGMAPALQAILAQAAALPSPADVVINSANMAALMGQSDLAIGAAGGTAWERCALGLPSLITALADNQVPAAAALAAAGAAIPLSRPENPSFPIHLDRALDSAAEPNRIEALSEAAAAITDGKGAERVALALEQF